MCGRFAQYSCRDEYFEAAAITPEEVSFDSESLVVTGTHFMLLNLREGQLHFEPVFLGYKPDQWHKAMLINARRETAASGRMFRPLQQHERAVLQANGWFEWARTDEGKQHYFIYHRSRQPLFFAAKGKAPFFRIMGQRDLSS